MDVVREYVNPLIKFGKDSRMLLNRCTKPDRKEFQRTVSATAIGFAMMGASLLGLRPQHSVVFVVNWPH